MAIDFLIVNNESEFPSETVNHCLICDDRRQSLLFSGHDDRFGYPGTFPILQCPGCGLVYLGVRIYCDAVPQLYQKYYAATPNNAEKKQLSERLKEILKTTPLIYLYQFLINSPDNLYRKFALTPGMRVLDVGSGSVSIGLEARRIINKGGDWLGVDVDLKVCQALQNAGLQSFWGTLEQFQETNQGPFDYIILSQVLEHVYHPRHFLKIVRSLLRPRGNIILSCPNYDSFLRHQHGQRWLHWHIPYHVAHYNRSTLTRLAEETGLRVSMFETVTPAPWLYIQEQMARGARYSLLANRPWRQRWLDIRFAGQHQLDRGDAIVAKLEIAA